MAREKSSSRYRIFATVVYPESAPDRWKDIIVDQHVPVFISPLHDRDLDPLNQPKKPHHHVMVMYDGVKTLDQARDFLSSFGGVGCEVVQSVRGYARYLCHLDNPEKAQYSPDDVICYAGSDYHTTIGLAIDRMKAIREMQDFCNKYNVVSFSLLCDYASSMRPDWHRLLTESCAYYMSKWLSSRKWSREVGEVHIVDQETGDIIY